MYSINLQRLAAPLLSVGLSLLMFAAQPVRATDAEVSQAQRRAAEKLCDVLHALPAQRKQACCQVSTTSLSAICTDELLASMRRGSTRVDTRSVERCADASAKSLQGCDWVGPLQPALPAVCASLIEGSAVAGSQCHSSLECADGLYCRGLSPLSPGVCGVPAKVGARCEFPADNLVAYARAGDDRRHPSCDGVCLRGQCLALADVGGSCRSTANCAAGLSCDDGRCAQSTPPALGEACSMSSGCAGGAGCISGICTAPKAAGASCDLPFECRSLECRKAPGAAHGQCADVCQVPTANPSLLQPLRQ